MNKAPHLRIRVAIYMSTSDTICKKGDGNAIYTGQAKAEIHSKPQEAKLRCNAETFAQQVHSVGDLLIGNEGDW